MYHAETPQFATHNVDELRAHPSYVRHRLAVPAAQLSGLAEQGDLAFREPLLTTKDGFIIDGYARWELARLMHRDALLCIEYDLTEEEALRWLLQKHRRSNGLNDFCRILLALDFEPFFREKARSNQQLGGWVKDSSNLTEDEAVDVRKKIAAAAAISVGNVTKVKQLIGAAHSELLEALRGSEVSIHRAWTWSKESLEGQTDALRNYRARKGVNKAIRDLISRQRTTDLPPDHDVGSIVRRLSQLNSDERSGINVLAIRVSGKAIFVSEELIQSLGPNQKSIPT